MGSMIQTRMFIGSLTVAHSLAAIYLDNGAGISWLVHLWEMGWILPLLLGVFGTLMTFAAAMEMLGHKGRACRELSASILGVLWITVWCYSWVGGADYTTFLSPVYIVFIAWAVFAEARAARQLAIFHRTTKEYGT